MIEDMDRSRSQRAKSRLAAISKSKKKLPPLKDLFNQEDVQFFIKFVERHNLRQQAHDMLEEKINQSRVVH